MKYFLDTEFSDTGIIIHPISIGIVAEDRRELYVEIDSPWREYCHPWILANVAPHLENEAIPAEAAAAKIRQFVRQDPAEFWAYWAAYDWVVFCQLFGGLLFLPKNVSPWIRDLAWLDPTLHKIRALKVHNPAPHHALHDARELREQYMLLTAGVQADVGLQAGPW